MRRMKDDELKRLVSKLNQKREDILLSLFNLEAKRREAQRQLERRMRKRTKEAEQRLAPPADATLSDAVSNPEPVRAIPYSEAHPYSKIAIAKAQARLPVPAASSPDVGSSGHAPDGLDVPDFLLRGSKERKPTSKDEEAAAEIRAQIEAKKKEAAERAAKKRQIKREMIQADLTGATRRMPLEGKAALARINER